MKKVIVLLAFLQGLAGASYAKTVDLNTAKAVGYSFLSQKGAKVTDANDLQMVYEPTTTVNGNTVPCYYVFSSSASNAFVIVSGDDNVIPILGYSARNIFQAESIRSNVKGWLDHYQKEISYIISKDESGKKGVDQQWKTLLNTSATKTAARTTNLIGPLLNTQWDQAPYYNAQCPGSLSSQAVTGCVATAMAQVMKFWQYPKTGSGTHTYVDATYGTQTVNYSTTTYAWSSMPLSVTTGNNAAAIAKLMYHAGVSVDMQYSPTESGSYVTILESPVINCAEYALKTYFNYRPSLQGLSRYDYQGNEVYTETQWTSYLINELTAGRPVIYSGMGNAGGHCWVCDGYDNSSSMFHFNWGWSGNSDGYFTVDNLAPAALGIGGGGGDFNSDQTVIIGIQPPASATANTNSLKMGGYITNNVSSPAKYGSSFSLSTKFTNSGSTSFSGDFCALVFKEDDSTFVDTVKVLSGQTVATGASTGTLVFNTATSGIRKMTSGLYHIHFYSRATGGTWKLIAENTVSSSYYPNNTNMSVGDQDGIFLVSDIAVTQNNLSTVSLVTGKPLTVKATIANYYSNTSFSGSIDASLYSVADGSKVFTIKQLANQNITQNSFGLNAVFTSANALNIAPGTYVLAITDKSNSSTAFETTGSIYYRNPVLVTVSYPTDIETVNSNEEQVQVYPNPATEVININLGTTIAASIRMLDMSGRQVINNVDAHNQSNVTIPVHGLAAGMYFVQIATENGNITRKVIVK